jgi:putative endonuclease
MDIAGAWLSLARASAEGGRSQVMYYAYALRSQKNGKYYFGHTENLKRRITEHNTKNEKKRFACANGPWELIFSEEFNTRSEAMEYEKFLKSGKGREYVRGKSEKK